MIGSPPLAKYNDARIQLAVALGDISDFQF